MKRRKWDSKTKATIVLEGLKGKPVITICQAWLGREARVAFRRQFGLTPPGRAGAS